MQESKISIVISAPSGGGKTTIINNMLSQDNRVEFVVSTTSRKKRDGEKNGKAYYFISPSEFKKLIDNDDLIEWSLVYNNYYGITKKEFDRIISLGKIPIFDVDIQGVLKLRKIFTNAVSILILPPSFDILNKRLVGRGTDSSETIKLRLESAKKELEEYKLFDYIIVNIKLEDAVYDLKAIIDSELGNDKAKVSYLKDKTKAKQLLEKLEDEFG